MGAFGIQGGGNNQLMQMLQMMMQQMQKAPQQAQQVKGIVGPEQGQMPIAPQVFAKPTTPNYMNLMNAAGSFVGQNTPEQKAMTAMKPPPNPWLPKGKL
jgi:hypothetical protein